MAKIRHKRSETIVAPYIAQWTGRWDGDDGQWATFNLSVGTPPQNFRLLPATIDSVITVPAPEGCMGTLSQIDNCGDLRGVNSYNNALSRGFVYQGNGASTSWQVLNLYNLFPSQNEYISEGGLYGTDVITLPGKGQDSSQTVTMSKQIVAGMSSTPFWLGTIGLGNTRVNYNKNSLVQSGLLSYMKNQSIIPSLSYSYTAGQAYNNIPGSLILGGYDANRVSTDIVVTPINSTNGVQRLNMGISSIIATGAVNTAQMLTGDDIVASIDSSLSHIWLPTAVCENIANAFGLTYDDTKAVYLLDDTTRSRLMDKNATLTFTVGKGTSGGTTNIVLSYKALDKAAGIPLFNSSTNYFPIKRAANSSQIVLGRTFLQESYLIVDWERGNFTLGPSVRPGTTQDVLPITTPSTASPSASSTLLPDNISGSSGIGAGAIAGIVVAVLAIAAIAAGIYFLRRRKRHGGTGQQRWSMMSILKREPPPPYHGTPEYYGNDKQEIDSAEMKKTEPQLSELDGGISHAELTSEAVARLEHGTVLQERELMSKPIAEMYADGAASELDSNSIRTRDSVASGSGTNRSSLPSPRRSSMFGARSPPIDEAFELE